MQTILVAIRDCGDGSQTLDWFYNTDEYSLQEYLEKDKYDSYQSGDGIQIKNIKVNSVEEFVKNNPHLYADDFKRLTSKDELMGDPDEYNYD